VPDTQSETEALLDIVTGIERTTIMLPEFQRDFRWELEQTYDLFDSLIREIFIGTIIYGKPSFGMTLREIDTRPRKSKGKPKGKGSSTPLVTHNLSTAEIVKRAQTQNLRIVLDGQQRITAIYRAIVGVDTVYIVLRDLATLRGLTNGREIGDVKLEELLDYVAGEESPTAISVKLSDAYLSHKKGWEQEEKDERFAQSLYAQGVTDAEDQKLAKKLYRRAMSLLIDLYKQQKMLAFYMLDMQLDKFCLFFERSNSRGIQLSFTDILAAKLYSGFNLRTKIEEFESQHKLTLNREIVVRAIAYISGVERGGTIEIDKTYILKHLEADDFTRHWDTVCDLYASTLHYLASQHYILAQDWMPSENMVIPLMMFLREIGGFDQMTEEQRRFIEFWYWASVFANRYSSATNEVIITDCGVLTQVARDEPITGRGYFMRLRSLITEPEDLFSYTKRASATYRGILNLLGYAAQGLRDWKSAQKIDITMRLEDHHIYPRAYIGSGPDLDMDQTDAEQLVDCVANRTLIPKLTNIRIGKRPPSDYLTELQKKNTDLATCLTSHLIPSAILTEPTWNSCFGVFLDERARAIFALIEHYAIKPGPEMAARYSRQAEGEGGKPPGPQNLLAAMIHDGRVMLGEWLYIPKAAERRARLVRIGVVEFEGQELPITRWGKQVTGWPSINIYESVYLERTKQPLKSLRVQPEEQIEQIVSSPQS
jgi:hypothetical protein